MNEMKNEKNKTAKSGVSTSILLVLVALVGITAASLAWFSIADNTRLRAIGVDITTGKNLRFDLDPHEEFEDYVKYLPYQTVADRVFKEKGYDMTKNWMDPVTTDDCETFRYENGTISDPLSGHYWEFTLHFMAQTDMIVHLTSSVSKEGNAGTAFISEYETLPPSMRISFTSEDMTCIWDPGTSETYYIGDGVKVFGLPFGENMVYNNDNALFSLKAYENKPVVVRIWMEGTDPYCNDTLELAELAVRMRFEGTDEYGNVIA